MADLCDIEVAYATPEKQVLLKVKVETGTTALEAIDRSGLRGLFPSMEVDEKAIGVFSRKVPPDYVVKSGDRIEIYRPLIADPKESRRRRAKGGVNRGAKPPV